MTVADGRHSWCYDLSWRALADPSRCASASIREGLGHSLKSAAKYTYFWDGRDSDLWPQHGAAMRCAAELAGLGPGGQASARHVRVDAEGQACMPLGVFGATAVITGRWGALLPLAGGQSHISDRFFLGGSDSLRGFARSGAGPTDPRRPPPEGAPQQSGDKITRDALGGNLLVSGCAAVTFSVRLVSPSLHTRASDFIRHLCRSHWMRCGTPRCMAIASCSAARCCRWQPRPWATLRPPCGWRQAWASSCRRGWVGLRSTTASQSSGSPTTASATACRWAYGQSRCDEMAVFLY